VKLKPPRLASRLLRTRSIVRAAVAVLALLTVFSAPPAFGSGDERTTNGDDLTIRTDTRWAGGVEGGYLPIRVRVSNSGPPRDLAFEFEPSVESSKGVRARRVIGVEQNATVHFTLPLPLVASRDGMLHVYEGTRELKTHSRSISVPSGTPMSPSPPAILVISPAAVECGRFVDASNHLVASTPAGRFGRIGTVDSSLLAEVVQSTLLPESWIDYSGLDFLAISREELERLEHPVRTAIIKWVQSGGNLLVYEMGNDPQAMPRLDRLIEAPEQPAGAAAWQSAVPSERPSGEIKDEPAEETTFSFPGAPAARVSRAKSSKPADKTAKAAKPAEAPWKGGKDAFRHRELMLGTVYAFPENPFPGTINDWLWICKSCGDERWSWTARHGTSPHMGTKDFYKFMNAGIHGVPTIAFLVLITLFSILIGPVNYVYLSRRKMLWLLLFTVPVMAVTTSALLVGYSVAVHGFSTKSRIRSLTVLDQRNRTAVTMARLALFAGVAPSGGMRFSPETAVFPVIPTTNDPTGGYVDWTQTQNLASGWLPARTRTQFLTVRNAEQRSRVELKPAADKSVEFWNGLPWELEMIVVSDDAGRLYVARSVAAGATTALSEPSADDLKGFVELLRRNAPALPAGFVEPTPSAFGGPRAFMAYAMRGPMTTDFASNLMERRIARWCAELPRKKGLTPRSYVAVVRENPGVETGVSSTSDQLSLHLLNGNF
jgi:hypothetical protein